MIGKLFGKKKDSFFLEIKEDGSSSSSEATPAAVEKKQAATESAQVADASAATSEDIQASAPTPAPTQASDPKEIIAAALKANAERTKAAQNASSGIFAPNYLVSAGNRASRRRPGASMTAFMDMASNMGS